MKDAWLWTLLISFLSGPSRLIYKALPSSVLPVQVTLVHPRDPYRVADQLELLLRNQGHRTLNFVCASQVKNGTTTEPLASDITLPLLSPEAGKVTPPCLQLRPGSSKLLRVPIQQVLNYPYTQQQLAAFAHQPPLRIRFIFEDCDNKQADYVPAVEIHVRL